MIVRCAPEFVIFVARTVQRSGERVVWIYHGSKTAEYKKRIPKDAIRADDFDDSSEIASTNPCLCVVDFTSGAPWYPLVTWLARHRPTWKRLFFTRDPTTLLDRSTLKSLSDSTFRVGPRIESVTVERWPTNARFESAVSSFRNRILPRIRGTFHGRPYDVTTPIGERSILERIVREVVSGRSTIAVIGMDPKIVDDVKTNRSTVDRVVKEYVDASFPTKTPIADDGARYGPKARKRWMSAAETFASRFGLPQDGSFIESLYRAMDIEDVEFDRETRDHGSKAAKIRSIVERFETDARACTMENECVSLPSNLEFVCGKTSLRRSRYDRVYVIRSRQSKDWIASELGRFRSPIEVTVIDSRGDGLSNEILDVTNRLEIRDVDVRDGGFQVLGERVQNVLDESDRARKRVHVGS